MKRLNPALADQKSRVIPFVFFLHGPSGKVGRSMTPTRGVFG
jgi:hypothetical protein